MAEKIKIIRNPNADSRTAIDNITQKELHEASISHINDVKNVLTFLANILKENGKKHDWTKIAFENEFFKDFKELKAGNEFIKGTWYQRHITEEKHHPFNNCHEDINLLDIIETIVDCVCSGKTRSGHIDNIEFKPEVLAEAVNNTIRLVDKITEVKNK